MLSPLEQLSSWERWALTAWLESLGGRGPADIRWSELPPPKYSRALGQLATQMGIRLPRYHARVTEKILQNHARDTRASKKWDIGR